MKDIVDENGARSMNKTNSLKKGLIIAVPGSRAALKVTGTNNKALLKSAEKAFAVKRQSVSLATIGVGSKKGVILGKSSGLQNPAAVRPMAKIKNSVGMYGLTTSAVDEAVKLFEEVNRDWG